MSEAQTPQSVLLNNLSTVRSIADAVRGTFGPQGLDVMLIDDYGDYTVTNDGVKILSLIETNHPAAKILIDAAKRQEEEVGDGTTTVTILVDAILSEAVKQVEKGVPIPKLIEGLKLGLQCAMDSVEKLSVELNDLTDSKLKAMACISGRGDKELVELVLQAAGQIGEEKLRQKDFKFASTIVVKSGAESKLVKGTVINKLRMNALMPKNLSIAKVLVIDDALVPEELPPEAVGTEQGFAHFQHAQQSFLIGIKKLIDAGVKLVLVDSNIHPYAEELFAEAGIMALQRVRNSELHRAAKLVGAKIVTRRILSLSLAEISASLGQVDFVSEDNELGLVVLEGGRGESTSTLIIGASTEAIASEQQRIATDVASALQASLSGGVVPGGGATELALIPFLEDLKHKESGVAHYGIDCLIEALKKPFSQICQNLGLNPLEKVAQVLGTQSSSCDFSLAINSETGEIASMAALGVYDPALVKRVALKTACEVAIQILKVNVIIKSRQIS